MSYPEYDVVQRECEYEPPWINLQPADLPLDSNEQKMITGTLVFLLAWARDQRGEELAQSFIDDAVYFQIDYH